MIKKIVILMLIVVLLCSLSATSFAADKEFLVQKPIGVGTRLTYISAVATALSIQGPWGLSTSDSMIVAYPGVYKVKISMYLQKYDNGWKTVKHWSQYYYDHIGNLVKDWYVVSGYYYRVKSYYYAYHGNDVECITGTYGGIWY